MPIENRNLEAGTRLAARYKGTTYVCEVVQTEEGIRYRLEDGREFKSPSSAASAVMGGMAANGWRFWSLAEELAEKAAAPKKERQSKKNGQVERFRCLHCMHIYKTQKSAASCRCAGATAARENTGSSNFEAIMVDPMNAIGEPPSERQAAEVAAQPEEEQAE
jgi:leucyl aminopeptidase (aminopeptidase T)